MKKFFLALAIMCSSVHAEGLYLTLGAGENGKFFAQGNSEKWNDNGGTGAFVALTYRWDKQDWCNCYPFINYAHISQWEVGGDEDWVDHFGVAASWQIFERRRKQYQ